MMKIPRKYIGWFGLAALLAALFPACTESQQDAPDGMEGETGIVCRTALRNQTSGNSLKTKLYVFRKTGGSNKYQLSDSVPEVINGSTRIQMNLADLNKSDYRFLFLATPQRVPEIQVMRPDGAPFTVGTEWEKVAVAMSADSLSVDNYYGIKDMPGSEILRQKTIEGELTRLVGQMVFCFYKADPGGVTDATVASVLDRISSIDITYQGVPHYITFDAAHRPVAGDGAEGVLHHNVRFSLSERGQKVELPQFPVEENDSIRGGAILKGTCLLPTQGKVRVSMDFRYYDTTPICELAHVHEASCYALKDLSLRLPKDEQTTGLSVLPDYFTINNARLSCDRIIDVLHTSGISIDTVWTKTSNN